MLRYDLDKLGWYEFEGLIQTLLKERLGLGVEAWGGSQSDLGRDAYYRESLTFPSNTLTKGPFIFQSKFVEGANAAGAQPFRALVNAVRAECKRISHRSSKEIPNVYALLTNVVLTPKNREQLKKALREVLPSSQICFQGGRDICALLDSTPKVIPRFPQLMGLRDLTELLSETVNADILNRSVAALSQANELAEIFVPTTAYYKAFLTLKTHHFAVLEGLPEMGKTAIARVIALAQVRAGWEAAECMEPEDIMRCFKHDTEQVFIADDFFGRTEYEPDRVSRWERELPHVLTKIDSKHWLILTSRAHLLSLAREDLDIGRFGKNFPSLGDVVVDANALTTEEKALILYKHAKARHLSEKVRLYVRATAESVVSDPYYTPERIRRLVQEYVDGDLSVKINEAPSWSTHAANARSAAGLAARLWTARVLDKAIKHNLKDPSKGMSVTFRSLPSTHKWMLIAFVESEILTRSPTIDDVAKRYQGLCPPSDTLPAKLVLEHLSGVFLKQSIVGLHWVHPSCRDLVIEQFESSSALRSGYLSQCGLEGLRLATSIGGGPFGKRLVPLLVDDDDWLRLKARALRLLEQGEDVLSSLVSNHKAMSLPSADAESVKERFDLLFDTILKAVYERAANGGEWTVKSMTAFYIARETATRYCPTVDPSTLLTKIVSALKPLLVVGSIDLISSREIGDLADFVKLIGRYDPSFLRSPGPNEILVDIAMQIAEIVERNSNQLTSEFSYENLESQIFDVSELVEIVDAAVLINPRLKSVASRARDILTNRIDELDNTLTDFEQARDESIDDLGELDDIFESIDDDYRPHEAVVPAQRTTVAEIFRDL